MYKYLYKYLVLNNKISFPGIGNFVVENVPSSIDEITHIIKPGQQIVHFSNTGENNFNHSLFSFLAKEQNQTETESENKFNVFIAQLKNYLRLNDVVLPA
jgi:nucleoid DNA-binding protein